MHITLLRSDKIYKKMMDSPKEKREEIYRYELMKPFEYKWKCINVPIKAQKQGRYDVIMASKMLGFLPPSEVDHRQKEKIQLISNDTIWETCKKTIKDSLERFSKMGCELIVKL